MVKKIVSAVILALLVVRLVTFSWPPTLVDALNTASLVVISVAAGVALCTLLGGGKESVDE